MTIQEELSIVGYTNQEMAEEADKNARAYLQKFRDISRSLRRCFKCVNTEIHRQGSKDVLFYWRGTSIISNGLSSPIA